MKCAGWPPKIVADHEKWASKCCLKQRHGLTRFGLQNDLYPAAVDVLSRTAPPKVEVKEEPLSVKMEGTAEHEPKTASQTQLESKPSNHSNKENVAPYKTPAAKKMAQYANTPGFTPPSTGYGFCAQAWKMVWSKRTT